MVSRALLLHDVNAKSKSSEVVARLEELLRLRDSYVEEIAKEFTEFVLATRDVVKVMWRIEEELRLYEVNVSIPVTLTHIYVDEYGNVEVTSERLVMRKMRFGHGNWGQKYLTIEHDSVNRSIRTCCWRETSQTQIPFYEDLVYGKKEKVAEYIKGSIARDIIPPCNIIGYVILVDFIVTNIDAIEAMIRSIITRRVEAMQRVISSATAVFTSERISEVKSRVQALAEEVREG